MVTQTERMLRVRFNGSTELERDWVPRADAAEVAVPGGDGENLAAFRLAHCRGGSR